jgi:hypothetical protein
VEHRRIVSERLLLRGDLNDLGAAHQQGRRLVERGAWE